jgi:hypothetical protein
MYLITITSTDVLQTDITFYFELSNGATYLAVTGKHHIRQYFSCPEI